MQALSDLFVQVLKLAQECGLIKLGTIGVGGTKIRANASRHKAMSYDRMQKAERALKEQIDALLAKAKAADAAERNEPEPDARRRLPNEKTALPSSGLLKHALRIVNARPISHADAPTTMFLPMTRASRKRSRASNTSLANPNPTPRTTSPIRKAGS